jgi:putative oxidoreductase
MSSTTDIQAGTTQDRPLIPALTPVYAALEPLTLPALRVVTGLLLVPHGAQKLFGWFGGFGLEGTAGWLDSVGFTPGYLFALAIGLVEFLGGIALALGLLTRPAAAAIVGFLGVAVVFHLGNGFFWTNGGYEYPLLWAVAALVFVVRGGGRYSLDGVIGRSI